MKIFITGLLIIAHSLLAQTSTGDTSGGGGFNSFDPCANSSIGMQDSSEKCTYRTNFQNYLYSLTSTAQPATPDAAFDAETAQYQSTLEKITAFYGSSPSSQPAETSTSDDSSTSTQP